MSPRLGSPWLLRSLPSTTGGGVEGGVTDVVPLGISPYACSAVWTRGACVRRERHKLPPLPVGQAARQVLGLQILGDRVA